MWGVFHVFPTLGPPQVRAWAARCTPPGGAVHAGGGVTGAHGKDTTACPPHGTILSVTGYELMAFQLPFPAKSAC